MALWVELAQATPGVAVTSSDGYLTATPDPGYSGVTVTVDFHTVAPEIRTVTVYRRQVGRDDVVVIGGDAAVWPDGVGVVFDHDVPLGEAVSYFAVGATAADPARVISAVVVTAVTDDRAWLKSLRTPSLSAALTVQAYPDWSYGVQQGIFPVVGGAFPVVQSDVRQAPTGALTVLTLDRPAGAALQALLASPGPLLLQGSTASGEDDRFVAVGAFTSSRPTRIAAHADRVWQLPLTDVGRPSSTGWVVPIPGHTYADTARKAPRYSDRTGPYLRRLVG